MSEPDSPRDESCAPGGPEDYSRCDLIEEDFSNRDLSLSVFTDARVYGADFSGATLTDTTFEDADCRRADFRRANLENSSFQGSDLRGADLRAENLRGTVFDGCLLNDATNLGVIDRTIDDTTDTDELAEIAATHRTLHLLLLREGRLRDARKFGHDHLSFEAEVKRARRAKKPATIWKYRFYYYIYKYGSEPRTVLVPMSFLSALVTISFGLLYPFVGIIQEQTDAGPVNRTVGEKILMEDFYHTLWFSLQKFVQGVVDVFRTLLLPILSFSETEVVRIPRYTPLGGAETLAALEYALGVLLAFVLLLSMIRILSLSIRSSTESNKTTLFSWLVGR